MAAIPFWSGKNARIVFFQDNSKVTLDVMSWTVKAEGEKVQDGVCGEDRDRLDFIATHFSISLNCQETKHEGLDAMLGDQDNQDANVLPLEKGVGFLIYPNNGSKAAYQAREVTRDDWGLDVGGRTARNKLTVPLRARYFDKVQGI